jgi:hypothetical protein
MTPLKTSSQPTNRVTAIPAIGGITIASMPEMIISTLSAIDHPNDFLTRVGAVTVEVLMIKPPLNFTDRMIPDGA